MIRLLPVTRFNLLGNHCVQRRIFICILSDFWLFFSLLFVCPQTFLLSFFYPYVSFAVFCMTEALSEWCSLPLIELVIIRDFFILLDHPGREQGNRRLAIYQPLLRGAVRLAAMVDEAG